MYVDPKFIFETNISSREPMLEKLLSMIEPFDTFMDIGAYVGTYSIPVGKIHNGAVNVIAFEPAPHCFSLLQRHLALNHVEGNVHIEELACGDFSGSAHFVLTECTLDCPPSSENRLHIEKMSNGAEGNGIIKVGIVSLDDYVARNGISADYVKIDVEGAELQVLRGAKRLLRTERPIVFCELHKFNWDKFHASEAQLNDLLAEVGYEMEDIMTGKPLIEIPEHCHVIMVPCS